MNFNLSESIEILSRTPATVSTLLHGLPNNWITINEGDDSWSPYDIIGHFIHGEKTDWLPRAKIILREEDNHFAPFDRFAQFENSKGKSLTQLLKEFDQLRQQNLNELKALHIQTKQLQLTGIHPNFGEVSLQQLLATWVVHDLGHIAQITRVMAKYYKEDTGPWTAFLPILTR